MARGALIGFFFALVAVAGLAGYLRYWWLLPLPVPEEGLVFEVAPGDSLGAVSRRLADRELLRHRQFFNALGQLTGADQRIRRGEYRIEAGTSPAELLELLQSGDTVRYLVTLPEGIRLREALNLLRETEGVRAVLDGESDPRLLELVSPASVAEGFFLPETYQYERGATDLQLLGEAHRAMRSVLDEAWEQRDASLPYGSAYELLIMASIIEKETGLASERATIGGVFVRRLQRGIRLQTDPTVIYGLGAGFDGNLRRVHLRDDSNPYNTYRHHGLPPGPIALPGREALLAAAHPEPGDALYFVARGDGSHAFSATLEEHEAAVRRFQLKRRADYRSTVDSTR
jgi:UPF0755 protein